MNFTKWLQNKRSAGRRNAIPETLMLSAFPGTVPSLSLERTNLDCFGKFLQEGTLGKRMCLPWLRTVAVPLVFSAKYQGLLTILTKPPGEAHPLSRLLFVNATKQAQYGLSTMNKINQVLNKYESLVEPAGCKRA